MVGEGIGDEEEGGVAQVNTLHPSISFNPNFGNKWLWVF